MTQDILLVTKGHPYEREPFYAIFDDMPGVNWTLVEQPAAQALFNIDQAQKYSAFVLYDMPGINFTPEGPQFETPDEGYKDQFLQLLAAGHGFVFLHHAIAGWPAWQEYAEIIGGRFLYIADKMRGELRPDSGYRHNVTHTVSVVGEHPVTAGLPEKFEITDELYLAEVFNDDVDPLLTSDYDFSQENFYSATAAVRDGKMFSNEGWSHPRGSNLIGWTKTYGASRIVYLQCGDDPVAYANPHLRKLIANAISWVSAGQSADI